MYHDQSTYSAFLIRCAQEKTQGRGERPNELHIENTRVNGGLDGGGDSTQPGEDAAERGEMLAPSARGADAVSVLWSFGKCLGALLPVYLAGYFGFSIIVVVLGLMVYMGWRQSRDGKESRLQSAMYVQENEQDFATSTSVFRSKRELPAWVNFPDVEKVDWLNKVCQAWPFVGQYLEKLLVETIAPSIRGSNNHLQTFTFSKVNLGSKPLRVVGVKAYTEHDKRQVLLDLYISYVGDVEINVEVKKYFCKAGVKGIQLHGKLRVILEPLIGDIPLVGAITMFFIRRPTLDINWTGLTNLLDIPGLNTMSDTMIMDAIASFLVLPNRLTVPLVPNLHVAQLRSPLPRGIVRIHLLEAESLVSKDNYGLITGKSDPYAVLRVGTQIFTSHHVENNLNPQWREMYEVIVHEVPGQELEVDWFTLKDTAAGRIHLKLEWLSLKPTADQLNQVRSQKHVHIFIQLHFRLFLHTTAIMAGYQTGTCYGTNSPQWEEAFTFFIQDPRKQDIDIQVKDDDRSLSLGSLSIPLSRLLTSPELTMDQWFQLDNSGPASRIYINAILRVRPLHSYLSSNMELIFYAHTDSLKPLIPSRVAANPSLTQQHKAQDWRGRGHAQDRTPVHHKAPQAGLKLQTNQTASTSQTRCTSVNPGVSGTGAPRFALKEHEPEVPELSHNGHTLTHTVRSPLICLSSVADSAKSGWSQVKLTLRYSTEENRLVVIVHACRYLEACSKDGSDPYVSFILQPDKNKTTKRKTSIKKKDLNPEYNERFDFELSLEEARHRKLDLAVKNSVSFMSRERELIGKVLVDLAEVDLKSGVTQW
uniref:Extended synaptotagmin 1 n=1 Tax=Scleropages formosus TaxID=113540 RepID=A0A8C9R2A7_SCLFO